MLVVGALVPGCTDVQLCALPCNPGDPSPPDNIVSLEGELCTIDPKAVLYPYKVLFVIDVSGSNQVSDPADNRAKAVQKVVDDYIENRSVEFGAITFNTNAEKQTPLFTRDYEVLNDAIISMRVKDQGTNYLDTLDLAYETIENDILETPEGERARTRYDIQWLSDGIPDPCQRPPSVRALVERLMELRNRYGLFDLVINTVQLQHPNPTSSFGCEDVGPADYLGPMADLGRGTFRQMTSDQLEFEIGFTEILRAFEQRHFFIVNENRVVWDDGAWPDSDGDGIRDSHDLTDPLLADANLDGCTDRVDEEMLPNIGLCADTCLRDMIGSDPSTLPDLDGDTLPDCAEKVLGYHRTRSDSDLDGFPDPIELKAGTNPLDGQPFSDDSDGDGVSDGEEIRVGTHPKWPENEFARSRFAYRYGSLLPMESPTPGTSCYQFDVGNVRLVETQPTVLSSAGSNLLCVYMVQTPLDDPLAQPIVNKACKQARYFFREDLQIKDPPDGRLLFDISDFQTVSPDILSGGL